MINWMNNRYLGLGKKEVGMSTFISYSRVNSEFVVRLAKDLKAAGYDVWLDQLDIPKGARWDDAIEAAVETSSTFMIVLAPESIESQNVKDELSYAIDSGKQILPVVIKSCKIPLRLRRFQYVDFTDKPYKDSLADIKRLLSNTARLNKGPEEKPYVASVEPMVPLPPRTEPRMQSARIPEPAIPSREVRENVGRPRKFLVPAILAVLAIAAVGAAVVFAGNRNTPIAAPPTMTESLSTLSPTDTSVPMPVQVNDQAGVTMRLVEVGDFILGSATGMADEKPVQTLYLDTYYIDKYEVTNALYGVCVKAGACEPPRQAKTDARIAYFGNADFDNYPVVNVDWNMARTYCEWRGARLPTEVEWEKAARGPDGRTYPWGEEISCNEANYFGCEGKPTSVSSYNSGLSVYGVYGMAGNVDEWVSSLYMPYPYDVTDGRENPDAPGERVIRGGSWLNSDSDNEVRSARRQKADPSTAADNIGFRCAGIPYAFIADTGGVAVTPLNGATSTAWVATRRSRKQGGEAVSTLSVAPGATNAGVATSVVPVNDTSTAQFAKEPTLTPEPPTEIAPTPTVVPPTDIPPTDIPPTDVPPTDIPPTDEPPTDTPPTDEPAPDQPTQLPVVE
jgi:formylglycine-generating enzyme required for sulfatase activity